MDETSLSAPPDEALPAEGNASQPVPEEAAKGILAPGTKPAAHEMGPGAPAEAIRSPAQKPVAAEREVWSVRRLVSQVRGQVEREYSDLWVEGEISNCRAAGSGHVYFTLKDGEAQLPVVLFRRQAALLRFKAKDGLAVLVRGRVSVYESRGQLQLIAETMQLRGTGALLVAFEELKARLLAEGMFAAERKRPLPAFPKCVGIVTSVSGAVLRDIATVVRRRHGRLNLLVYPATMQGAACAASVAAGIRWFNRHPERVELIVLARGGGSMEDLAGFNDEALARVIAASELPVVSAIGHETDFTIADFVADMRAATPSAAAELMTAAQHRIEERVAGLERRVHRAGRFQMMSARQRLARLSAESVLRRLQDAVGRRQQRIDELRYRLEAAWRRQFALASRRAETGMNRLRRQDPGVRLAAASQRLGSLDQRLRRAAESIVARRQTALERGRARLEALSPVAVLSRGYALVYSADGQLLTSADKVQAGEQIRARLGSGALQAQVIEVSKEKVGA